MIWVNSIGGIDSYQFSTPQETINLTKFNIKKGTQGLNEGGIYSDNNEGVFNASDIVIDTKATGQIRVTSDALNELEAYWLAELFKSKQVWMETSSGMLAPVMITTNTYQIPRLRFSKGTLNNISVDFTLSDGITPQNVIYYKLPSSFGNQAKSQTFTRNNCTGGASGTSFTYAVAANKYRSSISQYDANRKALLEIELNGQNQANISGSCVMVYWNEEKYNDFTKEGCPAGTTAPLVRYTVPAHTYFSTISLVDANNKALADITANGQNYANTQPCISDSTIFINFQIRVQSNNNSDGGDTSLDGFETVYITAYATDNVNTDITASFNYNLYNYWYTGNTIVIPNGANQSSELFLGTVPQGEGNGTYWNILSVDPSEFNNVHYTY